MIGYDVPANRTKMPLSAVSAGASALSCCSCGEHLTLDEVRTALTCYGIEHTCGGYTDMDAMGLTILPRYWQFLRAPRTRDALWYHATAIENWADAILDNPEEILVHVGSLESATARAGMGSRGQYMNVLRIKSGFEIAPSVVGDINRWPETYRETQRIVKSQFWRHEQNYMNFSDVTRYVNRYEIPGSISLLMRASAVDVVETYRL